MVVEQKDKDERRGMKRKGQAVTTRISSMQHLVQYKEYKYRRSYVQRAYTERKYNVYSEYVPLCAAYSNVESHFTYWLDQHRGKQIGDSDLRKKIRNRK